MQHALISKKRIRKAGDNLVAGQLSEEERLEALELVGHWRSAHIEPLHQTLLEIERICDGDVSTVLVSRLKRIDTIVNKLGRPSLSRQHLRLDTLRDIAGCRLIVEDEKDVLRYADLLSKTSMYHQTVDHMSKPKASGYRGIHVICRHDVPDYGYKQLNVEVQIRSHLQHDWATAVETYDQIKETSLKFDQGSVRERRYFQLASAIMSDDVDDRDSAIQELRSLDAGLHILEELTAASDSMFVTYVGEIDRSSSCLLTVDLGVQQVDIEVFPPQDEASAADKYTELETKKETPGVIYLLARAGSMKDLRFAYPNYSSDISQFVNWLTETIND